MDSRELLAMLSARSPRLDGVAGGLSRLRPLDVAGALGIAHVPPGPTALILAKYAGDGAAVHTLFAHWLDDRLTLAHREQWQRPRPGMVERLVLYSISENLLANRCQTCDGRGWNMRGAQRVECSACRETGVRYWGDRRIARHLEVGTERYAREWRDRVIAARIGLQRWEAEGVDGLARGLRRRAAG